MKSWTCGPLGKHGPWLFSICCLLGKSCWKFLQSDSILEYQAFSVMRLMIIFLDWYTPNAICIGRMMLCDCITFGNIIFVTEKSQMLHLKCTTLSESESVRQSTYLLFLINCLGPHIILIINPTLIMCLKSFIGCRIWLALSLAELNKRTYEFGTRLKYI